MFHKADNIFTAWMTTNISSTMCLESHFYVGGGYIFLTTIHSKETLHWNEVKQKKLSVNFHVISLAGGQIGSR